MMAAMSVPTQELHSRAAPSVGGSITAQSVQPQGEILEEDRRKKNNVYSSANTFISIKQFTPGPDLNCSLPGTYHA